MRPRYTPPLSKLSTKLAMSASMQHYRTAPIRHLSHYHSHQAAEEAEQGIDYFCTDGQGHLHLITVPKSVIDGDIVDEDGDEMDLEGWLSLKMCFDVEEYGECYTVTDSRTKEN